MKSLILTCSVFIATIGVVKKGQQIQLLGRGRNINSSVTDVQVFKRSVPEAKAGENVGVLLRGVKPDAIERLVMLFYNTR